jgi:hypothetical protein
MDYPYSRDLREDIVEAAGATSQRQAACFSVDIATAIRWMAAHPRGRARRSKLDPHEAFVRALTAATRRYQRRPDRSCVNLTKAAKLQGGKD